MARDQAATEPAFLGPGSASSEDLSRLDLRIGRILEASLLKGAHKTVLPAAHRLRPRRGVRQSAAQLTQAHPDPAALPGRLVAVVVNLAPRRVAGVRSEVLVLGALAPDGHVPLLGVDRGAEPGQRVAWRRGGPADPTAVVRRATTG